MKWIYYIVVFFLILLVFNLPLIIYKKVEEEKQEKVFMEHKHEIHIDTLDIENDYLNSLVKNKVKEIKENFLNEIKDTKEQKEFTYTLDIQSELFFFKDYISCVLFIEDYKGGAHPNHFIYTIVIDKKQNKIITLEDIIEKNPSFLTTVSKIVRSELVYNPKIVDTEMMFEGTRPIKENYSKFVLTESGFLLYFPPYQVAPYRSGTFIVLVEYKFVL